MAKRWQFLSPSRLWCVTTALNYPTFLVVEYHSSSTASLHKRPQCNIKKENWNISVLKKSSVFFIPLSFEEVCSEIYIPVKNFVFIFPESKCYTVTLLVATKVKQGDTQTIWRDFSFLFCSSRHRRWHRHLRMAPHCFLVGHCHCYDAIFPLRVLQGEKKMLLYSAQNDQEIQLDTKCLFGKNSQFYSD